MSLSKPHTAGERGSPLAKRRFASAKRHFAYWINLTIPPDGVCQVEERMGTDGYGCRTSPILPSPPPYFFPLRTYPYVSVHIRTDCTFVVA